MPIEFLKTQTFEVPKVSNINYCNFHSFMTYTTPVINDTAKTRLADVFYSYEEMSTFGLDCYYRLNGQLIKNHYVPTLYALHLDFLGRDLISSADSTLDNSYLSYSSDDGFTKGKNFLHYVEDKKHYNRKNMITKIEEIFSMNDIDDTTLDQVGENSWYAIEWTPRINNELSSKNSFLVFYKIRNESFNDTIKHSLVLGCIMNQSEYDSFWFTNNVNINNPSDLYVNKNFYFLLKVKIF
jgi:hypothetical protein